MPRIRALTDSAEHKAGEEWDASELDARVLCAPDLPGGARAEYIDRAMKPVEAPTPALPADAPPEKRRYMRRDLRAQN